MLKWKAPKRNQVRATSKWAATDKQNTSPRLTDDPLAAAINVEALVPHTKGMSRILGGPKRQPEPGQIYSVSRVNPLFVDSVDPMPANLSDGEKRLMDGSASPNRNNHSRTPSSSGYESSAGPEKRQRPVTFNQRKLNHPSQQQWQRHRREQQQQQRNIHNPGRHGHHAHDSHHHQQQQLVELSPASDYRRRFVLGGLDRSSSSTRSKESDVANDSSSSGSTNRSRSPPRRIGKANLLRQNPVYVTSVHVPSNPSRRVAGNTGNDLVWKESTPSDWDDDNGDDDSSGGGGGGDDSGRDHSSHHQSRSVPQPVWPSRQSGLSIESPTGRLAVDQRDGRSAKANATAAIVRQNEEYVTKILIAPHSNGGGNSSSDGYSSGVNGDDGRLVRDESNSNSLDRQDDQEIYDSIVTHSLLLMTSYDGKSAGSHPSLDPDVATLAVHGATEEKDDGQKNRLVPAELDEIGQLSQTISQSRMVATVSRALSKSSGSCSNSVSGSETYSSCPTASSSANTDSDTKLQPSHMPSIGDSIARRISLIKERWEKSSRRRLLVESDDDDAAAATASRRLDQLYVPGNGDVNFSVGQLIYANNDDRGNNKRQHVGSSPFSYLSGGHPTSVTIMEEEADKDNIRFPIPSRLPVPVHDYFEQDRLSDSSSRSSSGSRRVTFSADTVDNEQNSSTSEGSSKVSSSANGSGSGRNKASMVFQHQPIFRELKLNPQFLPHRYQQPMSASSGSDRSRLAGYYTSNLQNHTEPSFIANAKASSGKASAWEHYHDVGQPPSSSSVTSSLPSDGPSIIRMEPYGNLQLHPNYGAACQDRQLCVDFTLDGGEVSLLERRSHTDKLRRRLCCCVLLLLCLAVLVIVVIGISLYLSHGQKVFGSA